uniref:Uncharacterized protein n=1 Tax=Myoviridae sp. cttp71 TaxID=2825195 RepID=A0A8S5U3Z0_9CAUD|nr:MAG TPA: hypothetical protein [Myoviridae sp. cttp71]
MSLASIEVAQGVLLNAVLPIRQQAHLLLMRFNPL